MKIIILKEYGETEKRVSLVPETAQKLIESGVEVFMEKEAGLAAKFLDDSYQSAGVKLFKDLKSFSKLLSGSPLSPIVILGVSPPAEEQIKFFPKGSVWIGLLKPYQSHKVLKAFEKHHITAFALELVPRISRAQSMDVLSSQSNLAGYRAVIEAAYEYDRAFPLMMTAAGTIPPAKVLILGAGVAGLQAIATARRLGAVVSAFDVRSAAKEQVESLGAHFVEVEKTSTEGGEDAKGYAKEMDHAYQKRQELKLKEVVQTQDIVITTALIPGKPAPKLVTTSMLKLMKNGSVIVDMGIELGGNCEGTEKDSVVEKHGVTLIGYSNIPARLATDASRVFSKNIQQFLKVCFEDGKEINFADEIIKATALTHQGKSLNSHFG